MRLAMRIRVARQHAKLSQMELAMKLGVSRGAVANWESADDVHPIAARLMEIAAVTKVSVEWLVMGRGRMTLRPPDENDIPAVQGEFVYDRAELQLLVAFRSSSATAKRQILKAIQSYAPVVVASLIRPTGK